MHVLSASIQSMKSHRIHKKQKRTALRMLAQSGVVRPSHIELRYAARIASITAFRMESTAISHPYGHPILSRPKEHASTLNLVPTQQWARNLSSAIVRIANKPLVFRWSKQFDL